MGIGWATVAAAVDDVRDLTVARGGAGIHAPLTLADVDRAVEQVEETTGPGSDAKRRQIVSDLFARATPGEAEFLASVLTGGLRQGALAGVVASAISKAYGVRLGSVRKAAMLLGDLPEAGRIAATSGEEGLSAVTLTVGRPIEPMLAATAPDIASAMKHTGPASVEYKLDGIRIQVHKTAGDVAVFTRNLNDITHRARTIVAVVEAMPAGQIVLDGEVLGSDPYFFDLLHLDGHDLLERPLSARSELLGRIVGAHRIPTVLTADPAVAQQHLEDALSDGHEGAMVKSLGTPYEAGTRGKGWKKIKPVHTLDLVVLGAEWGHGRRKGWLSNLHLGAREQASGDFVMVGKTFKGLTDALLTWQTEEILAREIHRSGIAVFARPELVVEIAVDSSHMSTRYQGGVALRFARVRRYRPDKQPAEADTLEAVRALMVSLPSHDLPE